MLKAETITYSLAQNSILKETTVQFVPGKFTVIMGANGAGKSTLLKLLAGDYKPSSGAVYLDNKELKAYSKSQLAIRRAVLSQQVTLTFPISVEEIVLMGRYPYFATYPSTNDIAICKKAMAVMEVTHLAERDYTTLSGGEAQKVQMSRVLAQIGETGNDKVLFLDEPVSHLDVKFQYQLLKAAKELCSNETMVIAVLHDINLAIAFADRLLLMKEGRIIYDLEDINALTPQMIQHIFDIKSTIRQLDNNKPIVIF